MPDDRPILGEDAEPNPESETGIRAGADVEPEPTAAPGGSGSTPRRRNPRARRHEDDDEGYDAIDDGPVEVPENVRAALYEDACIAAEIAGLG